MTAPPLTGSELDRFSEFVKDRIGLHFPPDRYEDLRRGIRAIAAERGFLDPRSCMAWLMSAELDRTLTETLAAALTVGETYFFRDPPVFRAIEYTLLPAIISRRRDASRHLRIWSAGCSTGEEAYTLAIILSRAIPDIDRWSVTILATDINPHALKKAEAGIYGEWSFRGLPAAEKERYFKRTGAGKYGVAREIKDLVTFSFLNLIEDDYPSLLTNTNAMDLILCRNVLMYFSKDAIRATAEKLQHALIPDGRLIVSATETPLVTDPYLLQETCSGITAYRKAEVLPSGRTPAIPELPAWEPLPEEPEYLRVGAFHWEEAPAEEVELPAVPEPAALISPIPLPRPGKDELGTATRLFLSGDYAGAEKILVPYSARHPMDHRALVLVAQVLANRGNLAGARAWCDRAIAENKLDPFYHHLMATIRQEEGAVDAAINELRRALYADPSYIPAHFTLANIRRQQGNLADAETHYRNALALLRGRDPDEIIGGVGGMSAARLEQIISSITGTGVTA
jgi:chemotaxis protein methyltransferase CheR